MKSRRLPTRTSDIRRRVRRLVAFALGMFPRELRPRRIQIHEDQRTPHNIVGGLAGRVVDGGDPEIDLFLPADLFTRRYPRRFTYRKGAGELQYACWCEEVIATAAHEIRHVGQPATGTVRYYEVDAECHARAAVLAYRAQKRCRHAA